MGSKTSKAKGTVMCPKCGDVGQLKHRTTYYKGKKGTVYAQVDHWNVGNSHSSGYKGSCYIGVVESGKKAINSQQLRTNDITEEERK